MRQFRVQESACKDENSAARHSTAQMLQEADIIRTVVLSLRVIDAVSYILAVVLENVEHRQELPIIWHERFANHVPARNKLL